MEGQPPFGHGTSFGHRIAVVSGSDGAGQDAVAGELATRLRGTGAYVTELDVAPGS
jgi:hypothetical protein